jgi:hypothetical protein
MTDDLIRRLQSDWQSQEIDATEIVHRLRRTRWVPHLVLGLEILACCLASGVGVWFAWVANHHPEHRLLYTLSAVILLISAPVLAVASALARRASLGWHDETPESILRIGLRRTEASLRAMRVGHWHIAIIAGFVAVLWACQWLELIDAFEFLILYSSVCLVVALGSWLWMRWRARAVTAERNAYVRLLTEFRD